MPDYARPRDLSRAGQTRGPARRTLVGHGRVTADELPATLAPHPDVRDPQLVAEVAAVEPGPLLVARDEHGGVAVDLGVDLLVGEVLDLVRAGGGLEERLAVELARGALQRELRAEQLAPAASGRGAGRRVRPRARARPARARPSRSRAHRVRTPSPTHLERPHFRAILLDRDGHEGAVRLPRRPGNARRSRASRSDDLAARTSSRRPHRPVVRRGAKQLRVLFRLPRDLLHRVDELVEPLLRSPSRSARSSAPPARRAGSRSSAGACRSPAGAWRRRAP